MSEERSSDMDQPQVPDAEQSRPDETDALLSRLRLIEDQPLEQRAAAYTQLHDELQHALD